MIVCFITLEYSIFKVIDVLGIFCSVQWDQDSLSFSVRIFTTEYTEITEV